MWRAHAGKDAAHRHLLLVDQHSRLCVIGEACREVCKVHEHRNWRGGGRRLSDRRQRLRLSCRPGASRARRALRGARHRTATSSTHRKRASPRQCMQSAVGAEHVPSDSFFSPRTTTRECCRLLSNNHTGRQVQSSFRASAPAPRRPTTFDNRERALTRCSQMSEGTLRCDKLRRRARARVALRALGTVQRTDVTEKRTSTTGPATLAALSSASALGVVAN